MGGARTAAGRPRRAYYSRFVKALVLLLTSIAGASVVLMMGITVTDVVLRALRIPFTGAYDIVKVAGVATVACALPYTTSVEGHIAIEYFRRKLPDRARRIAAAISRAVTMGLFALLAWQCVQLGESLRRSGEVTDTLQLPLWPVLYLIAVSCLGVVLVTLERLLCGGEEGGGQ